MLPDSCEWLAGLLLYRLPLWPELGLPEAELLDPTLEPELDPELELEPELDPELELEPELDPELDPELELSEPAELLDPELEPAEPSAHERTEAPWA